MGQYLLRRLLTSLIVIIGVPTMVFMVIRAVPGDPADNILGEQAMSIDKERFRQERNLDKPLHYQYFHFLKNIANGSLGVDYENTRVTVSSRIAAHFPSTLQLAAAAMAIALLLSIPLGILSALKQYSILDHGTMVLALIGLSMPQFWLGPMLLIAFSIMLEWLPNPGDDVVGLTSLILPAITLGTALSAKLTRMTRSSVLECMREDYVTACRARGLSERRVIAKHVMRNALIPVTTIAGLQFGALLTGAIVTEKVFARPGVGTLLLDAIEKRNFDMVQGCVILVAFTYVIVNLLTDLAYAAIDPRIRYK